MMAYMHRPSELPAQQTDDDDDAGKVSSYCTSCGAEAPTMDSESTLISKKGWRLVLEADAAGRRVGAWRCPTCWSRHRGAGRPSIRSR
jgi:hypothetical protein